ncbi:MAG TPA: methylmalonyl Co-A mutase-associated GTPase MeaB [Thermomicrobiales bacterium]|nr:methylmalonyl Co-A mutase-associated GTPase MeaB [Thermomicrobiales bacterium]
MTDASVDQLVERFRSGNRAALSRILSHVENDKPAGLRALAALYRETGNAYVVGVTGPPGAGKSTLTNALIRAYRARGTTVGVLAVDPSSSLTGGATLGDRIRMLENFDDDGVYIRSMATRGEMGGLSTAVGAATHLLDAFGFDVIVIETVGVGQDEVDIAELADSTLLLQVPGLGDSIQTIKAGVLEIADILVVNKRDISGADDLVRDLRNMLRLGERRTWTPPIIETLALKGENISGLIGAIEKHAEHLSETGELSQRRERRARQEVLRLARRWLSSRLADILDEPDVSAMLQSLVCREIDPTRVAAEVARRAAREQARAN